MRAFQITIYPTTPRHLLIAKQKKQEQSNGTFLSLGRRGLIKSKALNFLSFLPPKKLIPPWSSTSTKAINSQEGNFLQSLALLLPSFQKLKVNQQILRQGRSVGGQFRVLQQQYYTLQQSRVLGQKKRPHEYKVALEKKEVFFAHTRRYLSWVRKVQRSETFFSQVSFSGIYCGNISFSWHQAEVSNLIFTISRGSRSSSSIILLYLSRNTETTKSEQPFQTKRKGTQPSHNDACIQKLE